MSKIRRLALLVLMVVMALIAVRLGIWQLDRLGQRRAANQLELAARELPALDLDTLAPGDRAIAGRRVVARGEFLATGQLLLRNRAYREAPGVHVVTPFRVAGSGAILWVLRGFANAADGVHPADLPMPAPGEVTVRGIVAALPVTGDGGHPAVSGGDSTWQRLDSAMAVSRLPGALPGFLYLDGGEDGPGRLAAVEPPTLDEGPHLSYAIQWFGIATAILAFAVMVSRRRAGHSSAPPPAAP